MIATIRDAWETIHPPPENPDGPLPMVLIMMTCVTGLVDSFSYLRLGRVFVANMTGNVVFLSFDVGGASGFIWWASVSPVPPRPASFWRLLLWAWRCAIRTTTPRW